MTSITCRLILVDDHPALTRGLTALFSQEPDLEVLGQFAHGEALLDFLSNAPASDFIGLVPAAAPRWAQPAAPPATRMAQGADSYF